MFSSHLLLLLVGVVAGSHYRGGTMSYTLRADADNITASRQETLVYVTQRHSWRRSAWFCNNTDPNSGNIIGEGLLNGNPNSSGYSLKNLPIGAEVRCTDYNIEFDYSSGENSTSVLLPLNKKIEYIYGGCCWIPLLLPDTGSNWSLKFIINTNRRSDGTWNNSPKTTMNPIVQVQVGQIHVIRIPMADSDGDVIRCRWGKSAEECGSICAAKGLLRSNPCELTYNATKIGYHAVAVVIEDFDLNNNSISAIPLQFLIHIVNITSKTNCTEPRIYIGQWSQDSCIGVESNTTFNTRVQIEIPCKDTNVTLKDVLTVSPAGFIKGNIIRDPFNQSIYTMPIQWTPQSYQHGIHQLCFTPVDSEQRTGSQMCLTFQVDVRPPEVISIAPTGLVSASQSFWIIQTDRDIVKPARSSGVYIRFFKRSTNEEVYRVDVVTNVNVFYQSRQITFFTTGYTWEQGEEYYILLDNGIAILNESCGVESVLTNNSNAWTFRAAVTETTPSEEITTTAEIVAVTTEKSSSTRQITPSEKVTPTEEIVAVTTEKSSSTRQVTPSEKVTPTEEIVAVTTEKSSSTRQVTPSEKVTPTEEIVAVTTEKSSSTRQTTPSLRPPCPRWFQFNTISNESTSANEPNFTFCFTVETTLADVTIGANTWVSCMQWKLSGTADPLLELYREPGDNLLAQNDDGNALALQNCYAAVLSYRLEKGDYRVIIRSPKCSYGKFEVRLSAEIDQNLK